VGPALAIEVCSDRHAGAFVVSEGADGTGGVSDSQGDLTCGTGPCRQCKGTTACCRLVCVAMTWMGICWDLGCEDWFRRRFPEDEGPRCGSGQQCNGHLQE
jgi:hypothetical protein